MPNHDACPSDLDLQALLLGQILEPEAVRLEEHLEQCVLCATNAGKLKAEDALSTVVRSPGKVGATVVNEVVEGLMVRLEQLRPAPPDAAATAAFAAVRMGDTPSVEKSGSATLPPPAAPASGEATEAIYDFLAPARQPGELGRLGPYRVLKVLGAGGMGVVFEAEDPDLDRRVALKAMLPTLARSPSARQRFLREARAAAAIEHDHIVHINQVSEEHGVPFLAMPLLKGESLEDRLKRQGALPTGEVLRIGREIAEGLAAAHEHGLIHRDVKPGNVWLEAGRDRVKILDFGLARPTADSAHLTLEGAIIGTPAYMAPEQVRGGTVDQRVDLFSLGCVLYRMATGELPFQGGDAISTLMAVSIEAPRPPRELKPELPAAVCELVMRLLAKKADDRLPSAAAVVEEIRVIEQGHLIAGGDKGGQVDPGRTTTLYRAAPASRSRRKRFLAAAVVLAGLVAVAGGLFGPAIIRYASDEGELVLEIDDPQVETVIDQTGVTLHDKARERTYKLKPAQKTSDLPAGDYEIEVTEVGGDMQLSTKQFTITRGGKTTVKATLALTKKPAPAPAPEEKVGEIRRFEGHTGVVTAVAFSPDGRSLLSGCGAGVNNDQLGPATDFSMRLWDVATGKERRRFEAGNSPIHSVAFSPDGRRALAGAWDGMIYLWDLESGKELRRFEGHSWVVSSVAFSADGRRALSASLDRTLRSWDAETGKELGRFEETGTQVFCAALSPDGRFVVSGHHDGAMRLWDVESRQLLRRYPMAGGWVVAVAFSPDGRHVVSSGVGETQVRLWNLATGKQERCFTGHTDHAQAVAFSPVGWRVLSGGWDKTVRLWDVETGQELCKLEGHTHRVASVAFSPDGRFAASGSWDGTVRLWRLPEPTRTEKPGEIKPNQGGLVLDAAVPDARVVVKQDGKALRTIYTQFDSLVGLNAGEYGLELAGDHEGMNVRPEKFTLAAGGRQIVRVRWDPLPNGTPDPARTQAADEALKALLAREADAKTDRDDLRADAVGFLQKYAGMPQIGGAARLLKRLPSPLDRLRREDVPEEEIATAGDGDPKQAPAGLVGVLGDNRLKHWDQAACVAYSPDGKVLATAGMDGLVKLWAMPSRRLLHTLTGHKGWVLSVAFSPDGLVLASSSFDGTARLWDPNTGKELRAFDGGQGLLWDAAFSPDGRTLATPGADKTIKLWNVATGEERRTLTGHRDNVECVAFSPDRQTLVSGGKDGTIRVWDLKTGTESRILAADQGEVNTVIFSRDGRVLATSSDQGLVKLWAMPSGKLLHTLTGHQGTVRCVTFSPDGTMAASAGFDKTIRLWDVETGQGLRTLTGHHDAVHCVTFAPDGKTLASASFDRTVRLWDVTTGKEAFPTTGHQGPLSSVAISPDGRLLASGSDDGTVKLWDAATGKESRTLIGDQVWVGPVAFSADGLKLASAGQTGVVKIWDVALGNVLVAFPAHHNWVSSVAFSPDGQSLASGSWDQTTKLWEAVTGRPKDSPFGRQSKVYAVAFSPDGKVLASGSDDGTIKLWEAASGKMRVLTANHAVNALAFSQDGRFLAVGGDGMVTLWVTATGETRSFTVPGHDRLSLALSPDGDTLAVTAGGAIHFWDTATGKPGEVLRVGFDGWSFGQIAFSPDGRHLITANRNDTLYILRLAPSMKAAEK